MKRYYTQKQGCPGCGIPGTERGRESKEALCSECKDLLEAGKEYVRYQQLSSDKQKTLALPLGIYSPCTYVLPQSLHFKRSEYAHRAAAPPYISEGADPVFNSQKLNGFINEFLNTLDVGGDPNGPDYVYAADSNCARKIVIPANQAESWIKLYDYLGRYMQTLEQRGKDQGKHILLSLLNKEIELYQLL